MVLELRCLIRRELLMNSKLILLVILGSNCLGIGHVSAQSQPFPSKASAPKTIATTLVTKPTATDRLKKEYKAEFERASESKQQIKVISQKKNESMNTIGGGSMDGGGGGNDIPEAKVDKETIKKIIEGIRESLEYKYTEMLLSGFGNNADERSVYKKLFLQDYYSDESNQSKLPKEFRGDSSYLIATFPIFKALDMARFEIQMDKPCYDHKGRAKDAAVVDAAKYRVCISAFNLSKKIPNSRAFVQLNAIVTHELLHILGANEDEAQAVQKKYFVLRSTKTAAQKYSQDVRDLKSAVSNILFLFDAKATGSVSLSPNVSMAARCYRLGQTKELIETTSRQQYVILNQYGYRPLDRKYQEMLTGILIRLNWLSFYCMPEDVNGKSTYKFMFSKRASIPAAEFQRQTLNSPVEASGSVSYINYADDQQLQSLINEIIADTKTVQEHIRLSVDGL